jgi:proline dehydrogenase
VDITLELHRRARTAFPNVGMCLQAYLHRTAHDIAALTPLAPAVRLVKGAYRESAGMAVEDVAAAQLAYQCSRENGMGREITI